MIIKQLCKVLLILAVSTPVSYSAVSDATSFDKSFQKEMAFGPTLGLIGFVPSIIGFNADIKNVNLFASTLLVLPILTEGEMYAFTIGGGRLIGIGNSGWKFNPFSHLSVVMDKEHLYTFYTPDTINEEMRWETNYAAGVGVGFQYTTDKGLLFSFKIPVVGFNFLSREIEGEDVALYYLYSGASLPIFAVGWSF